MFLFSLSLTQAAAEKVIIFAVEIVD